MKKKFRVKKGWIVRKVYPIISRIEKGDEDLIRDKKVKAFYLNQPTLVRNMLRWESRRFSNCIPVKDPVRRKFIISSHPDIIYCVPKSFKKALGKTPNFFCCPKCKGRLFWDMPVCGWCGDSVANNIDPNGDINQIVSLFDYLYPASPTPSISSTLMALSQKKKDNLPIVSDLPVSDSEVKQMMKNIEKYIPAVAYVD